MSDGRMSLGRKNGTSRRPSSGSELRGLLRELDANPPGEPRFVLVSRWAAKHVVRVDVAGQPWAYIRYLLGEGDRYPDRWRHLRLGELLNEIRVGPRVLGITPSSEALSGRAAIVEAALSPIEREELEGRTVEALSLFTRLHSNPALAEALQADLSETERERAIPREPLEQYFAETRERWFEAVVGRWEEAELGEIDDLTVVVSELLDDIEAVDCCPYIGELVPVHGDPNHGNFMLNRKGALRMIDFEDLALNSPVADLGVFLTWYVDADKHREILTHYPLADPDDILQWMRVWVPLRYLNIAAHWAARLIKARDEDAWTFAVESVDEWLLGAAEIVAGGAAPDHLEQSLDAIRSALTDAWPFVPRTVED